MVAAVMDFSKRKGFSDIEGLRKVVCHDSSLRVVKERLEKRVVKDRLENTKHGDTLKKRLRDEEERMVKCRRQEKNKGEDLKRLRKLREREREREAARIRLLEMEKTADIESNYKSYRELETLSGCSLASFVFLATQEKSRVVSAAFQGSHFWNPLEKLGLRLRTDDDCYDDVDEVIHKRDRPKTSCRVDIIQKQETRKGSLDDEKAARVAMLRRRYANIIAKAQQKTLFY